MYMDNNSQIQIKDSNNVSNNILTFNSQNLLSLGYGSTSRGYSTDICGNSIEFRTSSSNKSRMIINANGNVGIGTTAPSSKLDVSGTLKCTQFFDIRDLDNTKNRLTFRIASGVGRLYTYSDDDATFRTLYLGRNDTKAIVITSDSNIGIGTDNPRSKLEVNGSISNKNIINCYQDGTLNRLTIRMVDNVGMVYAFNESESGYKKLLIGRNDGTTITIAENGNVGIGTYYPQYKLDVDGPIRATEQIFGNDGVTLLIVKIIGQNRLPCLLVMVLLLVVARLDMVILHTQMVHR